MERNKSNITNRIQICERVGKIKKIFSLILVVLSIGILMSGLVDARDFNIYNTSAPSQNYFLINGTTGSAWFGSTVTASSFIGDGSGLTGITGGHWNVSGTDFYPENLNYNVGIGTTSPTSKLGINSTNANSIITLEQSGDGYTSGIDFIRERATAQGMNGGSIFMNSDTSTNQAYLYLQAQSTSAQAGLTTPLNAGNGARIIIGGYGVVNISDGDFLVNNSDFFVDVSSGKIGIGTTSPQNKLNVVGDGNFTGNLYSNGNLLSSTAGTLTGSGTAWYLPMWNGTTSLNNSNVYTDGTNVGIGTTSPNSLLSVGGIGEPGAFSVTGSGVGNIVAFRDSNNENVFKAIGSVAGGNLIVGFGDVDEAGNGNYFKIEDSKTYFRGGNVGIGTTSPQNKLNVIGDGNFTGNLYSNGNLLSSTAGTLTGSGTAWYLPMWNGTTSLNNSNVYTDGTNVGIGTISPSSKFEVNGNSPAITLKENSANDVSGTDLGMINFGGGYLNIQAKILVERGATGTGGDYPTDISFWNIPDGSTTLTERMRIVNGGNVGIGTTSPGVKLEVKGDILSNATINATGDICIEGGNCLSGMVASGSEIDPKWTGNWSTRTGTGNVVYSVSPTLTGTVTAAALTLSGTFDPNGVITLPTTGISGAGSGSGLDADLLDGHDSSYFATTNILENYIPYTGSLLNVVLGDYNFSVGTTDFFVDASTGKIGIGTTTPGNYKLSVNGGDTYLSGNLVVDGNSINFGESTEVIGDGGTHVYVGSSSLFKIETQSTNIGDLSMDGGNLFYDASTNRLGIGTSSPSAALVVNDSSSGQSIAFGSPSTAPNDPTIMTSRADGTLGRIFQRQISGSTNDVYIGDIDSSGGKIFFRANGATALTILEGGNVGIGTTSPYAPLVIKGTNYGGATIISLDSAALGANIGGGISFGGTYTSGGYITEFAEIRGNKDTATTGESGGSLIFKTRLNGWDLIERMRIDSSGNVGIGTTNPSSYKLQVSGDVGATAFYYTSDRRLKRNIKPLNFSLSKIMKLQGVSFEWGPNVSGQKGTQYGLIAQDVEKIYPGLVNTNDEGYKSVQYGNLVAPLIESIKELNLNTNFEINKLKKENEELKEEIAKIKKMLETKN